MNKQSAELNALDRECLAFSAYLLGQQPNDYVMAKYREAHQTIDIFRRGETAGLDRLFVSLSTAHPLSAKLVDAYTAIFRRKATVRRKWILLLAIMESCSPSHHYFDSPDNGGKAKLAVALLWRGLIFVLAFVVSIIIFMPFHIINSLWRK